MADIPWPKKVVPLTVEGFAQFYKDACADRAVARALADELEADGKRVFHHVFRMTKRQKPSIDNIGDDEFGDRVAALISELRSDAPRAMALRPADPIPDVARGITLRGPFTATLTCKSQIVVVSGEPPTTTPTPTPTPTPSPTPPRAS